MSALRAVQVVGSVFASISLMACASMFSLGDPTPSPYVEVFGNAVTQTADEYGELIDKTTRIEESAAILRISKLSAPAPGDYRIFDTRRSFLERNAKLIDVLNNYARLVSGVISEEGSTVIVRCVDLTSVANRLWKEEKRRDETEDATEDETEDKTEEMERAIRRVFMRVARDTADGLVSSGRGEIVEEIMQDAQPGIDDISLLLRKGQETLKGELNVLTQSILQDVMRIREKDTLTWTERTRLDELTLVIVRLQQDLRHDLERLDTAVASLPGLHRLVAANVFNIIEAEDVVMELSKFSRAAEQARQKAAQGGPAGSGLVQQQAVQGR